MIYNKEDELKISLEEVQKTILGCLIRSPILLKTDKTMDFLKQSFFSNSLYREIFKTLTLYRKEKVEYLDLNLLSIEVNKKFSKDVTERNFYNINYIKGVISEMYELGQPIVYFSTVTRFIKISIENEIPAILSNFSITDKLSEIDKLMEYKKRFMMTVDIHNKNINTVDCKDVLTTKKNGGASILEDLYSALNSPDSYVDKNLVTTGFESLDKKIYGFKKTNLVVIAGRSGIGKSTFGLNILNNITSKTDNKALFISLETSIEEVVKRRISMISRENILNPKGFKNLTDESKEKIKNTIEKLTIEDNLKLLQTDYKEIDTIINLIEENVLKHGISIVVIDYIQVLQDKSGCSFNSKTYDIDSVCHKLKHCANRLGIVIIALAQLSDKANTGKLLRRPVASDIKDSASIEQYADIAAILYREDKNNDNITELIIDKNRNGSTGTIIFNFIRECFKFEDCTC